MPDGHDKIETENYSATLSQVSAEFEQEKAKRLKLRKKLLIALAIKVGISAVAYVGYEAFVAGRYVTTDNAYVGASSAQVNALIPGTLSEVRVNDTQVVKAGDVLAVIDRADTQVALTKATADYRRAQQRVEQYFAQEAAAAAQVRARQADADRASAEFERRKALAETGAISTEELSTARAARDAAHANLVAAEEALQAQHILTRNTSIGDHPETVAARAAMDAASLDLSRTEIRAPIDGVVAQRHAQVGQRVQPGQSLMTVVPIAAAYVDANFKEGQLPDVKVGQPVELVSDLYGESVVYKGRVEGLGGGTGSAFAIIPAQNATGNWIKVVQRVPVRIALDPAELAARPLRVGLSMTATIDTKAADTKAADTKPNAELF